MKVTYLQDSPLNPRIGMQVMLGLMEDGEVARSNGITWYREGYKLYHLFDGDKLRYQDYAAYSNHGAITADKDYFFPCPPDCQYITVEIIE